MAVKIMFKVSENPFPAITLTSVLQVGGSTSDNGPLLMAGMAAAGLGVAALLSSSMQLLSLGGGVGR